MADNDNLTFETAAVPGVTFPTQESLEKLYNSFNTALAEYAAANQTVPTATVLMVAVQEMFRFPYHWLSQIGNEDKFASYIEAEAKHFLALMEFQKKALEATKTDG